MSCDYLPNKLKILLSHSPLDFNKIPRIILIIIVNILIIYAIFLSSKQLTPKILLVTLIIIIFSFGRNDFIALLHKHKQAKVQYTFYCISVYFTIFITILFFFTI